MKKNTGATTALTIASLVGTVLHGVLVRRASEKEFIFKQEEDQSVFAYGNVPKTRKEMVKGILPFYIPSIVVGVGVLSTIIFNHRINRRTIAGLSASVFALERGYRKYKDDIKNLLGGKIIHSKALLGQAERQGKPQDYSLLDDELLFYEEQLGYFTATLSNVMEAYGYLNQRLYSVDFEGESLKSATLNSFFNDAHAKSLSEQDSVDVMQCDMADLGWTLDYILEVYDSSWIHMNILESKMSDGTPLMIISWDEEPMLNVSPDGSYAARHIELDESNFKKINFIKEEEEY